jgi:hypothetical protein
MYTVNDIFDGNTITAGNHTVFIRRVAGMYVDFTVDGIMDRCSVGILIRILDNMANGVR